MPAAPDEVSGELASARAEIDRLRAQVRQLRDGGDDLGYVFVMTYGRSGSTLLMGLLNTIPGYLIRGENDDALRFLFEFHRTCVDRSNYWPVERVRRRTDPFFGIGDFPQARSLAATRRLAVDTLLRPKPDTRVTGYKEIRWWRHDDLDAYVAWLREVFPGARFLVNTRNHADVLKSKWWAKGGDKSEHLADIERRLLDTAGRLGDAAYHVHFDDYVADPSTLAPMFAWLGESYDEESVRATMSRKHSV
jgi:hypothetical protein